MRSSLKVHSAAIPVVLIIGLSSSPIKAQSPNSCGENLKRQAREQPAPKDWTSLYRLFKHFAACDDGAIGERFSADVAQLFSKQWTHLEEFDRLSSDKAFERFVVRHIDTTLDEDDLLHVIDNSKSHCPAGESRICALIHARAQESLDKQRDASE
jgi:hypothetical protein